MVIQRQLTREYRLISLAIALLGAQSNVHFQDHIRDTVRSVRTDLGILPHVSIEGGEGAQASTVIRTLQPSTGAQDNYNKE